MFPILERIGYKARAEIIKEGFFPAGGAEVKVKSGKAEIKPMEITEKGEIISIEGRSVASEHLRKAEVAERQARAAKKLLFDKFKIDAKIKKEYVNTSCPGSGIQLWIKTENTVIGANNFGERGKKSEDVGKEAAKVLIEDYEKGCVDRHTADQLIPYMAMMGKGEIIASEITGHIKTNAYITEKFLPVKFEIKGDKIKCQES